MQVASLFDGKQASRSPGISEKSGTITYKNENACIAWARATQIGFLHGEGSSRMKQLSVGPLIVLPSEQLVICAECVTGVCPKPESIRSHLRKSHLASADTYNEIEKKVRDHLDNSEWTSGRSELYMRRTKKEARDSGAIPKLPALPVLPVVDAVRCLWCGVILPSQRRRLSEHAASHQCSRDICFKEGNRIRAQYFWKKYDIRVWYEVSMKR